MFSCCFLSLLCDILTTFETVSDISHCTLWRLNYQFEYPLKLLTVEGNGIFKQPIPEGSFLSG